MSARLSAKQKRQKRFAAADLAERVRLAMPIAREAVLLGPDEASNADTMTADLLGRVCALIGDGWFPDDDARRDDQMKRIEEYGQAAYAIGIAVGLMFQPEAFGR